jgi:DNA-binding transcriptional LysR family regulator
MKVSELNFGHLSYFWTVARLGSVVAAARELLVSQPTISAD